MVLGHTRTAVVHNEALEHSHEIQKLLVQGLSAQKEKSDEEEKFREDRRLHITEEVGGLVRTGVVALFLLSWCRCVCVERGALDRSGGGVCVLCVSVCVCVCVCCVYKYVYVYCVRVDGHRPHFPHSCLQLT